MAVAHRARNRLAVNNEGGPLLTSPVHGALIDARAGGAATVTCSLDLGRSMTTVAVGLMAWSWAGRSFPYLETCRDRTIYH